MKQYSYLKRQFQPLTLCSKLVCITPDSPLTQYYSTEKKVYIPDRGESGYALKLAPIISATVSDGSWSNEDTYKNLDLNNLSFYLDGTKITIPTVESNITTFELEGNEEYGKVLLIRKNFSTGEKHTIWMEGTLVDTRTNQNIPIKTDMVTLQTSVFSGDEYNMSCGGSSHVPYDPLSDTKLEAEYLTAHGTSTDDPNDGTGYLLKMPIQLYRGTVALSNYTIKLFCSENDGTESELTIGRGIVPSATIKEVTIDLRLADKSAVSVAAYISNVEVSKIVLCSVIRKREVYRLTTHNLEDLYPNAKYHYDKIVVNYKARALPAAENVIDVTWGVDTTKYTDKIVGYGGHVKYSLDNIGLGDDYNTGYINQWVEHQHKEAYALSVDESNNYLVDESGNYFIIN